MKSLRHHSLQQLKVLGCLLNKSELNRQELMFILSELPTHGLLGFKEFLPKIHEINSSSIFKATVVKKNILWTACQSELQKSNLLKSSDAMKRLYGEKSFFYKNPKSASNVIIIAFTTMFNNFHFSNAVLASILFKSGHSFLIVKDTTESFYLNGIPDFGSDFEESVLNLQYFLVNEGFKSIRIMSYSAGGYASILYASKIKDVSNIICFSPRTDYSEGGSHQAGEAFEGIRNQLPEYLCKNLKDIVDFSRFSTSIVFGSENKVDQSHAQNLLNESNIKLLKVRGCGHDTPSALLASGKFDKVMSELFF